MNFKIRTKIVLIALVSLLLAIGINATISSYIITREYSDALQSQALVIGQGLELQLDRLLKYGIFLDEVVGFEKQCQEIVNEYKDTSYAMVVDTEGKILFHNDPSQRGQRLADPVLLEAAKGTVAQVLEVYPRPGEGYFDVTIPIRDSRDRHVAAVKVGLPTRLVAQRTQALLLSSGATALVSLGLAVILLLVMLPPGSPVRWRSCWPSFKRSDKRERQAPGGSRFVPGMKSGNWLLLSMAWQNRFAS